MHQNTDFYVVFWDQVHQIVPSFKSIVDNAFIIAYKEVNSTTPWGTLHQRFNKNNKNILYIIQMSL